MGASCRSLMASFLATSTATVTKDALARSSQTQLRKLIVQLLFAAEDPKLSLQLGIEGFGLPERSLWAECSPQSFVF